MWKKNIFEYSCQQQLIGKLSFTYLWNHYCNFLATPHVSQRGVVCLLWCFMVIFSNMKYSELLIISSNGRESGVDI
jgi:hypothetical protein